MSPPTPPPVTPATHPRRRGPYSGVARPRCHCKVVPTMAAPCSFFALNWVSRPFLFLLTACLFSCDSDSGVLGAGRGST